MSPAHLSSSCCSRLGAGCHYFNGILPNCCPCLQSHVLPSSPTNSSWNHLSMCKEGMPLPSLKPFRCSLLLLEWSFVSLQGSRDTGYSGLWFPPDPHLLPISFQQCRASFSSLNVPGSIWPPTLRYTLCLEPISPHSTPTGFYLNCIVIAFFSISVPRRW